MMEKFSFVKIGKVSNLSQEPGVYCFADDKNKYLYIGKAVNIRDRAKNHIKNKGFKENLWLKLAKKIGFIETGGEIEALMLEATLIKELRPAFNVMWRDDKNFFYIAVSEDKLPRLCFTHQPKESSKFKVNPPGSLRQQSSKFIGPFVDGRAIKTTLRYLRRIFPYYTQKRHPKIPCQWCQLSLCPGPNPNPEEYKNNIKELLLVLRGKKSIALKKLEKEMTLASGKQDFEKAAALRNKIYALKKTLENAKIFSKTEKEERLHPWPEIQKHLKKILKFAPNRVLNRVEAYDVSNIQGKQATGSMAVFIKGRPAKQDYRHFRIRTKQTPDDFEMMRETISRRFKHPEWTFPDFILIDGGKPQLTAAQKALKGMGDTSCAIRLLAIAKKHNELYLPRRKKPMKLAVLPRELANFILHVRDEAHRFAKSYHLKLRNKMI